MSLSKPLRPNQGVIQITTDDGTSNVCWQSLNNSNIAKNVVCRQLGYEDRNNVVIVENVNPSDTKQAKFLGTIQCNGNETALSQCSIKKFEASCTVVSYIKCKYKDIQRFHVEVNLGKKTEERTY